jgi:tetratricopeptide (TPR) repeat protein
MGMKNNKNFELVHRLKRADEFEGGGKMLHAIQLYQAIITDFPDDNTAWFKLIEIYEKMDKVDAALGIVTDLYELKASDTDVQLYAGHFYFKYQKWEDSIEVLANITIDIEPIAYFMKGLAYFHTGFFQESADHLVQFVNVEKSSSFLGESYLYIARCYFELKQPNVAIPYLDKAEKLLPTNPEVYFYQASYYLSIGMFAHASERISTSIALGAEQTIIFEKAVEIYEKNGETAKMEEICKKFIANNEPSAVIYTFYSKILLNKNRYREAEDFITLALKLDPKNQKARDVLTDLTERRDNDLVKNV